MSDIETVNKNVLILQEKFNVMEKQNKELLEHVEMTNRILLAMGLPEKFVKPAKDTDDYMDRLMGYCNKK